MRTYFGAGVGGVPNYEVSILVNDTMIVSQSFVICYFSIVSCNVDFPKHMGNIISFDGTCDTPVWDICPGFLGHSVSYHLRVLLPVCGGLLLAAKPLTHTLIQAAVRVEPMKRCAAD